MNHIIRFFCELKRCVTSVCVDVCVGGRQAVEGKRNRGNGEGFTYQTEGTGAHLVDVFEFVDDLADDRVGSLHPHLGVSALSLDTVPHHPHGVAGNTGREIR